MAFLYAETESHHVKKIKYYSIFLNDINNLNNSRIKLKDNGKLHMPAVDLGRYDSREINPNDVIVFVIGNKNFTPQEVETAKKYAKENGLRYVGECDLADNFSIRHAMEKAIGKNQLELAAYTFGATVGALQILPEVGLHISRFFSRVDGGNLASTRRGAAEMAHDEEAKVKEKLGCSKD